MWLRVRLRLNVKQWIWCHHCQVAEANKADGKTGKCALRKLQATGYIHWVSVYEAKWNQFERIWRHVRQAIKQPLVVSWRWQKSFVSSNYDIIEVSCQINIKQLFSSPCVYVFVCVHALRRSLQPKGNYIIIFWHFQSNEWHFIFIYIYNIEKSNRKSCYEICSLIY